MRTISAIIVHCSASIWGNVSMIDRWHKEKNWKGIGYHYVILNGRLTKWDYKSDKDGQLELGRDLEKVGAHVHEHNENSIGICVIGNDKFSRLQHMTLITTLLLLMNSFGLSAENVKGHYELDENKTCPNMDMDILRDELNNRIRRSI